MEPFQIIGFLTVGLLWGTTNAFIEKGTREKNESSQQDKQQDLKLSESQEIIEPSAGSSSVFSDLKKLFTNLRFVIPYALNQTGSILNNFVTATADLSIALPTVNCLAFIFTFITQRLLNGQSLIEYKFFAGCFLIMIGLYLSVVK
ncbi:UNKNOWN [Stylonychia lemnae]|uniref:Transmembrane protein 234 homolog n=1 Tax=Stylonychia lemnae TaxID=5949 RepID=A0A078B2S4_STYLE|nr:UNKNOWN [Stylonychia lemnae]|eukprot:CDW88830.1 UNKNOWN [Stylonychia lemnae]